MIDTNYDECIKLHRAIVETNKKLSTTVRIDHNQVLQILVSDLISKYRALSDANDPMNRHFKAVLLYYIGQDDLDKYYEHPELIYEE